jgi:anti-sigma B factor antagonist
VLLHVTTRDGRAFARFARPVRLTEENAAELAREFGGLAEGPQHLDLDLAGVVFLSSIALAQLVALHRKAASAGGSLVLRNARPDISRVFELTRLDRILDIEPLANAKAS